MARSCLSNPLSPFPSWRKLLKKKSISSFWYIYILREPIFFCILFLRRAVVICLWWKLSSQFIDDIRIEYTPWGHIMLWKPFQSTGPICPTKTKKKKIKATGVGFLYFLSTLYILTHFILTTLLLSPLYKWEMKKKLPKSYLISGEPGIWTHVSVKFMHSTILQYYVAVCTGNTPFKIFHLQLWEEVTNIYLSFHL